MFTLHSGIEELIMGKYFEAGFISFPNVLIRKHVSDIQQPQTYIYFLNKSLFAISVRIH